MSDEQTQQAAPAATAENTAADSATDKQTAEGSTKPQEQQGAGDQTSQDGQQQQQQQKQPEAGRKSSPRRSASTRIQTLANEVRDLKEENARLKAGRQNGDQSGEDEHQNGSQQDSQQPNVRAEVERLVSPLLKQSQETADDAEISELFTGERAALRGELEPAIREMWKQDQYKDVSAADLFRIARYDADVAAAGQKAVEAYKAAEKKAKEESTGGNSSTSNRSGSKPVSQMTDQELLEHNEQVKAGKTS